MTGDDRPPTFSDRLGGSGSPGTEQVPGSAASAAPPTAPARRPMQEDEPMGSNETQPLERREPAAEEGSPGTDAPAGADDDRDVPEAAAASGRDVPDAAAASDRDVPAPLRAPSGPYLPSVVLGLVLAGVAAVIALDEWGVDVDLGVVVPVAMVVLGLLLVLGAVATAVRERRR